MSDSDQELESELRRLTVCRPSMQWMARLEADLAEVMLAPSSKSRTSPSAVIFRWRRWAWGAMAVAGIWAGVAVLHFASGRSAAAAARERGSVTSAMVAASHSAPGPVFKPVSAAKLHYASFDEGLTRLNDGWPARRVYDRYLDVYTWRNPHTQAFVQWTIPRDEMRLVPLNAY